MSRFCGSLCTSHTLTQSAAVFSYDPRDSNPAEIECILNES